MRITKEFQVTLPREVIESMTILPEKTDLEFLQSINGRWYLSKIISPKKDISRFRSAYLAK